MPRAMLAFLWVFPAFASLAQPAPYAAAFAAHRCELLASFSELAESPLPEDTAAAWLRWKTVSNYTFGKNRGNLVMVADLDALHPYFRMLVKMLIAQCKARGIELAVVESFRTRAKQNEYRSMGKKYTRSAAGTSKHQYGLAVDVVPMIDSVAVWDNLALWRKVGAAGEKLGLRWGGRWRHPFDPGHFEWTQGLSVSQLEQGIFPAVPLKQDSTEMQRDLQRLRTNWEAWEAAQAMVAQKSPR